MKSFDDLYYFSNYRDNFLNKLGGEDLQSNLGRAISFDSTGFKGSKICIVKKITGECQDSEGEFLESGSCIYTTLVIFTERDYSSLREENYFAQFEKLISLYLFSPPKPQAERTPLCLTNININVIYKQEEEKLGY